MYLQRIGRFPSPDPLIIYKQKYPELSSYQFASNTPIQAIDLDGLEAKSVINEQGKLTAPAIEILRDIVPGGAEVLKRINFKINDSFVPEGMSAITWGSSIFYTKEYAKSLENKPLATLASISHEGTHLNDVVESYGMFYLEYGIQSAAAFVGKGKFSITNKKTGKHIHDDLPLEQKAINIEGKVNSYLTENSSLLETLKDNELDDRTKSQLIRIHKFGDQRPIDLGDRPPKSKTPEVMPDKTKNQG